ncbi:polysaccharide biosynthesis C-terminal domain-containing protein, partial [bacterium]|nr:polysaccharide biosynthesis C-terminal domain-containing protein [bacterium]MBU1024865.1 polysaccharide biosynthesis C-terminal domain-containing protein [bacterium]
SLIPFLKVPFGIGQILGLRGITYGHIMMTVFMAVTSLILISFFIKWKLFSIDLEYFTKGLKSIGFYAFGAATATFLFFKVAVMVITYYIAYTGIVSDADLGRYSQATQIIEKVLIIPGSIAFALLPKVTSKSPEDVKILTAKSARHTLLLTLVSMGVLSIFIRPVFLALYGEDFVDACYPFWALAPGIIFYAVGRIFGTNLLGTGKVFYAFYFSIFTLILNLVLNILWVPKWGITGSAYATSSAYIIHTMLFYWAINRESKIPFRELLVFKKEDWEVYSRGFIGIFSKGKDQNGA